MKLEWHYACEKVKKQFFKRKKKTKKKFGIIFAFSENLTEPNHSDDNNKVFRGETGFHDNSVDEKRR